jgi:hypothetical protein
LAGGVIDESSVDDTGAVPEGGTEENAVDVALPYGGLLDGTITDDEAGAVESEIPVDGGTAADDGGADDGGADDGSSTGKLVRVPSVKVEAEIELEALCGGMSVHQITPDLFSVQDVTNDLLGPGVTELGGAMVSVMTMTLVRTTVLVEFAAGEGEGSVLFETPLDDGGLPVGVGVPPVPGNEVTGGRAMSSVLLEIGGL